MQVVATRRSDDKPETNPCYGSPDLGVSLPPAPMAWDADLSSRNPERVGEEAA